MQARTRSLSEFTDRAVDLNDFAHSDGYLFVRDGVGVAGQGCAARIASSNASEFLASIDQDTNTESVGSGVILLGCVPFTRGEAHSFVLPAVTLSKDSEGHAWITTIDGASPDLEARTGATESASSYGVRPGVDVERYLAAVATARDAVRNGELIKVVIARDVIVESSNPIEIHALLTRLRSSFGSSYRYSFEGFVGASPELLLAINGSEISSHPLAGTTRRTGDPKTDAALAADLLASAKNQIEHRVVVDMVHDTLLPWCSYLDEEPEPSIVAVANVQHLGTHMSGILSQPAPNILDLVYALSPTPALGGHPRHEALELIAQHEGFDRGRYGGAVGWMDSRGNGTWAVAIRCAELSPDRRTARLFAGGGIVADSDPLSELAETQAKLQAMLAAIIRP